MRSSRRRRSASRVQTRQALSLVSPVSLVHCFLVSPRGLSSQVQRDAAASFKGHAVSVSLAALRHFHRIEPYRGIASSQRAVACKDWPWVLFYMARRRCLLIRAQRKLQLVAVPQNLDLWRCRPV